MNRKLIILFAVCVAVGAMSGLSVGTQWVASGFRHAEALGWRVRLGSGRELVHVYPPWQWLVWRSTWPPDVVAGARSEFQQAFVFTFLGAALGMMPMALWRWLAGGYGAARRRPREFGQGRWANRTDITAAGLVNDPVGRTIVGRLIDDRGDTVLSFSGVEHQLVVGPSRSGKGVGHVVPTLFVWPESCFCYDVKGELWNLTAARRRSKGHVLFWNPTHPGTARYNPLLEVRRDHATGDVQKLAKMLVNPGGNRADDDIWDRNAEQLLVAIVLHVLFTEPVERKHLGTVREKVLDLTNTLIDMLELPHRLNGDGEPEVHPEVRRVAASFADKTSRFRSSVAGTLEAYLTVFADEHVVRATSACDFRMSDLACADRPMTVYVQVPPADVERMRPLTRLIVDQACRVLLHDERTDAWGREKQHTTLMLLDEFPSLGRIDAFANHMKLMASFKVKGMLVVQSVNDIVGTYGPTNTIIDNSHLVVAFATADVTSLERISRMTGTVREYRESYSRPDRLVTAGRRTISESETVQPLMTPGDVRELPYDEQLILINGTKPIRTKKFAYYEHPQLKRYAQTPPEQHPGAIDAPPRWASEWEHERAKGDRVFHPLAAKLREELHRSDEGPEAEMRAAPLEEDVRQIDEIGEVEGTDGDEREDATDGSQAQVMNAESIAAPSPSSSPARASPAVPLPAEVARRRRKLF
jgi:type IV secretion system protein VirD4